MAKLRWSLGRSALSKHGLATMRLQKAKVSGDLIIPLTPVFRGANLSNVERFI
jgi:hypothetical protein